MWAQILGGGLVLVAGVAIGGLVQDRLDERGPDPARTPEVEIGLPGEHDGSLATAGTLVVGWTLTAMGGTVGRRRLDDLEDARWKAEWAGVEPVWSGRVP